MPNFLNALKKDFHQRMQLDFEKGQISEYVFNDIRCILSGILHREQYDNDKRITMKIFYLRSFKWIKLNNAPVGLIDSNRKQIQIIPIKERKKENIFVGPNG